jgi:SAM-dependent methyltransferase
MNMTQQRFAFGKNWQLYAQNALTQQKVSEARNSFRKLFAGIDLRGKSFLDVGFGQGLTLFLAQEMGAKVFGIEIDAENIGALTTTAHLFAHCQFPQTHIVSILDESFIKEHKQNGQFDIVHAWGVLHHTGDMRRALDNSAELVKNGEYLVLAIYNKHWSSPIWKVVKWTYNVAPRWMQWVAIYLFYPIIYLAKWMVTRENPKSNERGMDFWYNIIDWVGGYPYEYASISEVNALVSRHNFVCLQVIPAQVPTGCNQFVFRKRAT